MAISTLAKSPDPYPLLAEISHRPARLRYRETATEFRVFLTGKRGISLARCSFSQQVEPSPVTRA